MEQTQPSAAQTTRYRFIDQCRGYAVFGMILVNVLGMFDCMPWMLKHHHEGFSYADHIAPLFMFIVGMGFHISYRNTARREGASRARRKAARRYGILMGLGLVTGGFSLLVAVWDALMDIGASGMIALPFMGASWRVRLAVAAACLALYQGLFSWTPYGAWQIENSINGGPLGPLSWVFILLMGTIAADIIFGARRGPLMLWLAVPAVMLSAAGWLLRMEWPGVKSFWPFSQYAMSAPYPLYAAGLCFVTVLLFYLACERLEITLPHLTLLGRNPLVLYLLQAALVLVARVVVPDDIFCVGALLCFAIIYGICYGVALHLHRSGRVIKI